MNIYKKITLKLEILALDPSIVNCKVNKCSVKNLPSCYVINFIEKNNGIINALYSVLGLIIGNNNHGGHYFIGTLRHQAVTQITNDEFNLLWCFNHHKKNFKYFKQRYQVFIFHPREKSFTSMLSLVKHVPTKIFTKWLNSAFIENMKCSPVNS